MESDNHWQKDKLLIISKGLKMFSFLRICDQSSQISLILICHMMIFWQKITDIKTQELKGNLQWERRGAGKVANVRKRSRTMAITVCLSFNLDVVYNFNVFPFPLSKAQSLGDVPMNRQNASNCSHPFWTIFVVCVLMQRCTLHH